MKPFQLITIGVAIFLVVAAVVTFALTGANKSSSSGSAPAVVWGTLPASYFNTLITQLSTAHEATPNMIYVEKNPTTFDNDLLEALADGKGPDAIVVTQADIFKNLARISVIPYTSYPQRQYLDTFVPEAQLFETHNGLLAIPVMIDPMVMYWNKDTLIANNIPLPPKYWGDLVSLIPKLTVSDQQYNIQKATIALGDYSNVAHAKDILSTLFLQTNDPITDLTYDSDRKENILNIFLDNGTSDTGSPAQLALNFYTQFSNPVSATYTWNKSLSSSTDQFLAGDEVFYLGFASEYPTLQADNPNLNFDVTTMPQSRSSNKKITLGNLYGIAILNSSKNQVSAYDAALFLTQQSIQQDLVNISGLPPVRLDLLQTEPSTAALGTFYEAALQSQGWIDPNPQSTETIFHNMIESVTSGDEDSGTAVTAANNQMQAIVSSQ